MDTKRRQYISELRSEVSKVQNAQKRDEETLKKIPSLNLTSDLASQKKTELINNINRRFTELDSLKTKIVDIQSGKYDSEMTQKATNEQKKQKARNDVLIKKKKEYYEEEEIKKNKLFSKEKDPEKYLKKDYNYFYKIYCRINETLPEYIQENIKTMPGNKGYIWRGCWFFGLTPAENNQPIILFEKKGGVLRIHEIDDYDTKIYEKIGKDRKKLVSCVPRTKKKLQK